jgi:hypothetical protein
VPPKTIYVKDADLPLWERIEKAVKTGSVADSVSALISEALRLYLAQFGDQGGGLYVQPPDDDTRVTFDHDTSAVLAQDAATGTWDLRLDAHTYPDAAPRHAMGHGALRDMVAAARTQMAEALTTSELENAAARLRRALGIGSELTATDGRTAGRAWALQRATPGELEAICELAHREWVSFGASGAADPWPTLRSEMARHGLLAGHEDETWEVRRDDFTVGFVGEACAVYDQILETDVAT